MEKRAGTLIQSLPNLQENSEYYHHQISFLENENNSKNQEIIEKIELIDSLKEEIHLKNVEINILEKLKNYKLESKKDFILNIINTALADIFQDSIRIDIEQEVTKSGKVKYNIVFYQNEIQIAKNEELLESNGGGVLSIISVLFKILIGYIYSKNKFYIFDESFSQVSPNYRERLSLFLRKLAEQYGFTIVIVSQTGDLNIHAHRLYEIDYKYVNQSKRRKKKNEDPNQGNDLKQMFISSVKENPSDKITERFYSEIENFQSIKKEKFIYEGFTVIVGPNNSGKSASLRAIKALIFNDFKERYLRIGETQARVVFGREDLINPSNNKEIILKYKSKKVIYEIDGEEYLGKNLASEVIKKEVEKIGFRYIDIKSLYKNIKGDLRQQAEQISYSSQHDNLFLVGNKSGDIEKIFNFLFNTEQLTSIIVVLKEEILEINNRLKEYEKQLEELKYQVDVNFELIEFFILLYKIKLIEEYINASISIADQIHIKEIAHDEILNIISLIEKGQNDFNIIQELSKYISMKIELEEVVSKRAIIYNDLNIILHKLSTIQEAVSKIEFLKEDISNFENYLSFYKSIIDQINYNKEIKQRSSIELQKISEIDTMFGINLIEYINVLEKVLIDVPNLKKSIDDWVKIKEDVISKKNFLEEDFKNKGFVICKECQGLGLIHIKENK